MRIPLSGGRKCLWLASPIPSVPLPRSKSSCDGKFYYSSSLSSSSPAQYSHPRLLPQALHLRLTISLTSCMYVDTIVWPPLLPMPTCFRCYLLAHICCLHVLSDPTSQTHHLVYLPRSQLSRFRFSPPNAHGCKSVCFPAWTELSLPHCT